LQTGDVPVQRADANAGFKSQGLPAHGTAMVSQDLQEAQQAF
jgi:hypothetical protein